MFQMMDWLQFSYKGDLNQPRRSKQWRYLNDLHHLEVINFPYFEGGGGEGVACHHELLVGVQGQGIDLAQLHTASKEPETSSCYSSG